MFPKYWKLFLVAVAALFVLAACSSDPESSDATSMTAAQKSAEETTTTAAATAEDTGADSDEPATPESQPDDAAPVNPALALLDAPIPSETPYETQFVEVDGVNMAYVEAGDGDPILFVHGNPTSKYLWRNIMPHVEDQGRVIALDLVGFGESDRPDIEYTPTAELAYLEGFIEALELTDITLVLHDWGSHLGFSYASQNEDNIKAIAFMESQIGPGFPVDASQMPEGQAALLAQITGPQAEEFVVEQNAFVAANFTQAIIRPLSEGASAAFRGPYEERGARIPVLGLASAIPLLGAPTDVSDRVEAYNAWFMTSEIPKLHLYATPGGINPPEVAQFFLAQGVPNYEAVFVGFGIHFIQEDEPEAIGRNLSDWYLRVNR